MEEVTFKPLDLKKWVLRCDAMQNDAMQCKHLEHTFFRNVALEDKLGSRAEVIQSVLRLLNYTHEETTVLKNQRKIVIKSR